MKIGLLQLALVAFYLAGCTATHYHVEQSDRVTFYLEAPEARAVLWVSSLDAYSPHPADKISDSRWAVTVAANSEFRYFYIVDGSVYLPDCQFYEKDDFGSRNCIYVPE